MWKRLGLVCGVSIETGSVDLDAAVALIVDGDALRDWCREMRVDGLFDLALVWGR